VGAWDRGREGWRTFRVDRHRRPTASGRFTARRVPGGDAAQYVRSSIAGAFSRYEARVTVHAPANEVARRLPWVAGALEPIDEARCEYRTADENLEWLALRVAMLGVDVEVHEPPELIEQLKVLATRLQRAAYGAQCP
jgi:predicted DNA-binding transcriptional regulator YafY